jgi:hypothetical protein
MLFFHKIVGPAHSYGNHGYLRKRGSALQRCILENMPENDVPGFMTLFSLLDLGQVVCNYDRLENRLLIPNDNSSL